MVKKPKPYFALVMSQEDLSKIKKVNQLLNAVTKATKQELMGKPGSCQKEIAALKEVLKYLLGRQVTEEDLEIARQGC